MKEPLTYRVLKTLAEIGDEISEILPRIKSFNEVFKYPDLKSMNSTLYSLKTRGYVERAEMEGRVIYKLTPKGRIRVIKEFLPKNPKWDGKWRIVVFDIPHKKKRTREAFRRKLYELGFKKLQKSVWIFPYDVTEQLELIIEYFYIKPFVKVILADLITDQKKWKKKFNLKTN